MANRRHATRSNSANAAKKKEGKNGGKNEAKTPPPNSTKKSNRNKTPTNTPSTKGRRGNNNKVQSQLVVTTKTKKTPKEGKESESGSKGQEHNIKSESKKEEVAETVDSSKKPNTEDNKASLSEVKEKLFDKEREREQ